MIDTKLEPGRDLDVRIAKLLFGPEDEQDPYRPLAYSTDPAAAMGLLQEVLARPSVIAVTISVDSEGTTVSIELEESPFWIRGDHHSTIEAAIALACHAALEADRAEPGG